MKKIRGYIFSRSFFGERVPQNVQNLVIRDYCNKLGYQYLLSSVEYTMKDSSLMLNSILKEIKNINGIIFYSYFQLPSSIKERNNLYKVMFSNNKSLHFALENIEIRNLEESLKIDETLSIKRFLVNSDYYEKVKNYFNKVSYNG